MKNLRDARLEYQPTLPRILKNLASSEIEEGEATPTDPEVAPLFPKTSGQPELRFVAGKEITHEPKKVGVVLSGGQAPGGHNVIAGLFDALKQLHPDSQLFGFIGGPSGIVENRVEEITKELLGAYRNLGGFDIIGSGRTKIESKEQLEAASKTAENFDGIVVIGGDDSNTNAAVMAEHFDHCAVIGVPKTIDGDLKNEQIEISFGHDTACRVYAEMVGNLMRDAASARKYWHFVRLMGRSASHITLEVALQTHPNLALIGEEVRAKGMTLDDVVDQICEVVSQKDYGVILIPEGLLEFVHGAVLDESVERDPHGNIQLSAIETEKLLSEMCQKKVDFKAIHHFFGYEGRSGMPTNFDCNYCYALGYAAARLIQSGRTGYMSSVSHLERPPEEWCAGGMPITEMLHLEERKGEMKPVIAKALVELDGPAFVEFDRLREGWKGGGQYGYPGPIQFAGDVELTDQLPLTLQLESKARNR